MRRRTTASIGNILITWWKAWVLTQRGFGWSMLVWGKIQCLFLWMRPRQMTSLFKMARTRWSTDPFLFIIAVECFAGFLTKAVKVGLLGRNHLAIVAHIVRAKLVEIKHIVDILMITNQNNNLFTNCVV